MSSADDARPTPEQFSKLAAELRPVAAEMVRQRIELGRPFSTDAILDKWPQNRTAGILIASELLEVAAALVDDVLRGRLQPDKCIPPEHVQQARRVVLSAAWGQVEHDALERELRVDAGDVMPPDLDAESR